MSLRPYNDLAQEAGLSTIPGAIPTDSAVGQFLRQVVTSMNNRAVRRLWIIGVIGWSFFLFFFVFWTVDGGSFGVMFPLFFLGPFIIGAVIIVGYQVMMATLLGTPDIRLSHVLLRRGDQLQIHYRQPVKRNLTFKSMAFTLVFQESATYNQGTTTVTETHDNVIAQDINFDVAVSQHTGIDRQLTFTIPDTAMHTFEVERNKLNWFLRVKFDIPSFPDFHKVYKLQVLPEVTHES